MFTAKQVKQPMAEVRIVPGPALQAETAAHNSASWRTPAFPATQQAAIRAAVADVLAPSVRGRPIFQAERERSRPLVPARQASEREALGGSCRVSAST